MGTIALAVFCLRMDSALKLVDWWPWSCLARSWTIWERTAEMGSKASGEAGVIGWIIALLPFRVVLAGFVLIAILVGLLLLVL